jgi:putative thioredoxin
MKDITQFNLEADLVNASLTTPVLLDIWAPWCGPCRTLGPMLERLETAYAGRFLLAKLDSDAEQEIAGQLMQMFGVRSIPFCVLFKGGQPVDGFVGALPEAQIRQFLDKHVAPAGDAPAEGEAEDGEDAERAPADRVADAQAALEAQPQDEAARYALVRALIDTGRVDEAQAAYAPARGQVLLDGRLTAVGHWLDAFAARNTAPPRDALDAALAANKRDFDARFASAQRHFADGRFTDAMDELLEILMRDKAWKDELARKTYVAVLEMMAKPKPAGGAAADPAAAKGALELSGKPSAASADPVVDGYRRKLSMVLF